MLDKEAIREAADIQVVAEEIGIPIQLGKKRPLILCPCHNDRNFGSCYLDLGRNEFKCYSCGAHGDVFDLVQAAMGVSFGKAKEIVAEICGGTAQFETNDRNTAKAVYSGIIPKADQEFIGIKNAPVYADVELCDSLEELDDENRAYAVPVYDKEDGCIGYRLQKRVVANPLYALMQEDPEMYRSMIDNFCESTIERYHNVITLLHKPDIQNESLRHFAADVKKYNAYEEIARHISSFIKKAQNISAKYGNGKVTKAEYSGDAERLSAIANSIWAQEKEAPF